MQDVFEEALRVAELVGQLGQVDRLTRHPDGTPETDTTHSMMLAMVAWNLAHLEVLDASKCVSFALVHDMPEAIVGDTPTLVPLTPEDRRHKDHVEAVAVDYIKHNVSTGLAGWIRRYESKEDREARFVWVLDKAMPKVVRAWRGRLDLPEAVDMTAAQLCERHASQRAELLEAAPDVPVAFAFFDLACAQCEAVWGSP